MKERIKNTLVRYENVCKTYHNSSFSLSGIELEINRGEFVLLTGKTGAGKTTLIKMAYGEEHPTQGRVFLMEKQLSSQRHNTLQKLRRRIGLVFQENGLMPDRNIYENIAFPLYINGSDKDTVKKRVSIVLRLVGLSKKRELYPRELSGGEKQKACMARAIVSDPDFIIADEPTGNIDKRSAEQIMEILWQINEKGTTVLLATHDTNIVKRRGCRMVELSEGRIAGDFFV
jgi:cell division transport system ATP-binding protein